MSLARLLTLTFTLGSASAQTLLYDVRVATPVPTPTAAEQTLLSQAIDTAVLAGAWSTGGCSGGDRTLIGKAGGAFTARGAAQVAYLYTSCFEQPNASQQGLIVTQGNRVVAHYAFTDHFTELYAVRDVNRNGYTELALIRTLEGQGTSFQDLALAELQPARRFITLTRVASNDCGNTGMAGWTSQVLRVTPGSAPRFTAQSLQGPCNGVDAYQRVTSQGAVRAAALQPEKTGWVVVPLR